MFDHLEYSVSDIDHARAFYGGIVQAIGGTEVFFDADGHELGLGRDGVVQLLLFQGNATGPAMHVCFQAQGKDAVTTAHTVALKAGGTCNGPPGYRDHYGPGYFAAFMKDADGHNVEVLFREPQS